MQLEAVDLSKRYGGRTVLDGVDLTVRPGTVTILLGPNGAGKTSLLRLLDLLERPDGGEVRIDGCCVSRRPFREQVAYRRRLGFVFQTPLLFEGSVRFNLEYAMKLQGRTLLDGRLEEVLAEVDLSSQEMQAACSLSGGEKQRLQLARVLLQEPEVYFLDEPTASLDPLSARGVERVITAISAMGRTVIWSTHNLLLARRMGQDFVFLSGGRILQQGEEIFSRPQSQDIATYADAGNLLDGHVAHHANGCRFCSGELELEVTTALPDGQAMALIRPEEILLSSERLNSSARNSLAGVVKGSQNLGLYRAVSVETAGVELTVFVTTESMDTLGIQVGCLLWLTVKSTAVHVFR